MSDAAQRNTDYWGGRYEQMVARRRFEEPMQLARPLPPTPLPNVDIPALLERLQREDHEWWSQQAKA